MNTILVVAAHPDDEVIGCGGTLARHVAEGDKVHVIFLADGESSREIAKKEDIEIRTKIALDASKILGIETPLFLGLPDNRLDSIPLLKIVQAIESASKEIEPSIVYTHHRNDLNIDHGIAHQAVMTAFRPIPRCSVTKILCFEVASSTEWQAPVASNVFIPNVFVNITNTLSKKCEALNIYSSELRDWPHSRSLEMIEYIARVRGGTVGCEAAEAFMLVRDII